MAKSTTRIFKTDKRIKLGIWGLGRGRSFFESCANLNIDVVAGCDFNEHMRKNFSKILPNAYVTDKSEDFLKQDFDAVLLATYCPNHAEDAMDCLKAGKHVLSEVTAFHTLAEGVKLVEAVEKSGLIYNLAENYPFSRSNMYLADQWRKGLFGDLMYAEYEYVHECRVLTFTYIDGVPVIPGNTVHNWRSWINFHYYNTHSLGPVMHITGTRPTRVVSLPSKKRLAGYVIKGKLNDDTCGITPSLITMSNGAVMRNLLGETTNDVHHQRIWGTLGAAEVQGDNLLLRLGAAGQSPKLAVNPKWPMLDEEASRTGHGGGDFWVLYYFARHILTGEPGPFDIYGACDVTIPGILALRSAWEGGKPYDVPDFRSKSERNKYRNDKFAQKRYDIEKGCFPKNADPKFVGRFTHIMKDLVEYAPLVRAYLDWDKIFDDVREKKHVAAMATAVIKHYREISSTMKIARALAEEYPNCDGGKTIFEMLELGCEEQVQRKDFVKQVTKRRQQMIDKIKSVK
jgi:predicted dehydrogenase